MGKPTLIVHTTYFPLTADPKLVSKDPERLAAEKLGLELYEKLTRPLDDRLSWGAGVSVRIATRADRVDPGEAEHVVVVPVLGARSHEQAAVRTRALDAMRGWKDAVVLLPVPTSPAWRAQEPLPVKPLLTDLYGGRRQTLDEIVLAIARRLAEQSSRATRLFISHAKGDLDATERAAEKIRDYIQSTTTSDKPFFDTVSLLAGDELGEQIDDHAGQGVFVVVRSDTYSSRTWCVRELLKAKRMNLPIITVDVMKTGEGRSFAYSGNSPTIVWRWGDKDAAAMIASRAMVECVKSLLFLAEAKRIAEMTLPGEASIHLVRPPELLDVAMLRSRGENNIIVVHPDPELSVHERAVLLEADKRLRTVTPTTAFNGSIGRASRAPLDGMQVALSLSKDPVVCGLDGVHEHHVQDATVFLARTLLGAGAAIAYGGDFRTAGYTEDFAKLIVTYNQTARRPADLLHSYLGAHLTKPESWELPFTAHHLGDPFGGTSSEALLEPPPEDAVLTPARRALYFSDMRRVMESHVAARIVISGSVTPKTQEGEGYVGRYPGVVEEAWRALASEHALYVIGGFGGAAALVADLLESPDDAPPRELDEATWSGTAAWTELVAGLDSDIDVGRLCLPRTQLELARMVRGFGAKWLASDETSLRWNGLTIAENRTLFRLRDPLSISSLVMKGLLHVATQRARGKLRIELVEGDVTEATDVDVVVFPAFSDLELDGAGLALDSVTGNAATRSHRARRPVSPSHSFGADFVQAADLGPINESTRAPVARVRQTAGAIAESARRYGFGRIGLVTFLGNVVESLGDVVGAMVEGFRGSDAQLRWFERDRARAALLAKHLVRDDVELTRVVVPPIATREVSRKPRTIVAIRKLDGQLDVSVLLPDANGIAPNIRTPLDDAATKRLARSSFDAAPSEPQLQQLATSMRDLLLGTDADRILSRMRDSEIVLVHDAESSGLPYEALGWIEGSTSVNPATRGGIVRHLVANVSADRGLVGPSHNGDLGLLLVIDPTSNLPNATVEGNKILERLAGSPDVKVTSLREGAATIAAVRDAMQDPTIDIVHYCGHAFYDGPGTDSSGLVLADGNLTLAELQKMSRLPRLAVFNACQAARVRGAPVSRAPQTFAEFFLHGGVDAYVGTFWLVGDEAASMFAAKLYEALGRGAELGDAVTAARAHLQREREPDWANYVLYGRSGFRMVRGTGLAPTKATEPNRAPVPAAPTERPYRIDGSTIVAWWTFAADAPSSMSISLTEWIANEERPAATRGPIRVDQRQNATDVQWIATITLASPPDDRAFRIRGTGADPIDIGTPPKTSRAPSKKEAFDELVDLKALIDQQEDGGRALLLRMMPGADPGTLRADIDTAIAAANTRAVWPLDHFFEPEIDEKALAAFAQNYPLGKMSLADAKDQHFQTKEDWARYASAKGGARFHAGFDVLPPLSIGRSATDLSYDIRAGEMVNNSLTVALFADNGNGIPPARAICKQIVDANVPYAFHLGDVYYGGTQKEIENYFYDPLKPMLDRTELFMITGNHEMYALGEWFQHTITDKRKKYPARQRQVAETYRLRGPGFQFIGLDTMFVGWNRNRPRLHDYADKEALDRLDGWLSEDPNALTVLLSTNEAWDMGSDETTRLYRSVRDVIAGRVDMWFWGNVHYASLYELWGFTDAGSPTRNMVTSCIGHGGYPFYTQKKAGKLPSPLACRWTETKSRFWPDTTLRPELGLNGWCTMTLTRSTDRWTVSLVYKDWVGRDRLRANLERVDGRSILFRTVEESALAAVGAQPTWRALDYGEYE